MQTVPAFLEITPKISPAHLSAFLRGLKGVKVSGEIGNAVEAWVDFEFDGGSFQCNRDVDVWRFFADPACPKEAVMELRQRLAIDASSRMRSWRNVLLGAWAPSS